MTDLLTNLSKGNKPCWTNSDVPLTSLNPLLVKPLKRFDWPGYVPKDTAEEMSHSVENDYDSNLTWLRNRLHRQPKAAAALVLRIRANIPSGGEVLCVKFRFYRSLGEFDLAVPVFLDALEQAQSFRKTWP